MRRILLAAIVAGGLAGPLPAQDAAGGAIADVISRQLQAFETDDFATAFGFASPMIREMFRTPEIFGQMVRQGYPMVYRPGDVRFLDLRDEGGSKWQSVMIRDAEGRVHMLEYEMIETPDGWQIDGVRFIRAPEVGA